MAKRNVSTGLGNEAGGVATRILVFVLLAVVVLGLAKLFSVQNSDPVTVFFYNWRFTSTRGNVILGAFCLGAVVMALLLFSLSLRMRFRKKTAKRVQATAGSAPGSSGSTSESGS